jgi:hypothetical protein
MVPDHTVHFSTGRPTYAGPSLQKGTRVALVTPQSWRLNFLQLQNGWQQLETLQITLVQFEKQDLAEKAAVELVVGAPSP